MIRKFFISTLLVVSSAFFIGCQSGQVKEESVKKDIKIVSTTVAPTEVLDKLGIDLVGVPTSKKALPERYNGVQTVGSAMAPNMETIVSLTPDLVIIDNNFKNKYEKELTDKGLKGFYFDTSSIEGFTKSIEELSVLTGTEKQGQNFIKEIKDKVENELKKSKKLSEKPTVAVLFGTSESSMLATDKSYVGDLLESIGVLNITDGMQGVESGYVNFSLEEIVKLNPDYILRLSHGDVEQSKKDFDEMFSKNPAWSSLNATKEGKVYDLNPNLIGVSANIEMSKAIEELGKIIYGE